MMYLAFDTQDAMREYEKGCRDPTLPAFNMFLSA